MGDRLQTGKPHRYATSHPGQLSLVPYANQEMSTSQSAMTLCGWGLNAGFMWINVWVADKTV